MNQKITLERVFEKQRTLIDKYGPIEAENSLKLWDRVPLSIDSKRGQEAMRLLAWRFTEEIGEAIDADYKRLPALFREEVADAFHFLVEILIFAGVSVSDASQALRDSPLPRISMVGNNRDQGWLDTILELTLAINRLKNRPWSRTEKPLADIPVFRRALTRVFRRFFHSAETCGISYSDLLESYEKKNEINHARIQNDQISL